MLVAAAVRSLRLLRLEERALVAVRQLNRDVRVPKPGANGIQYRFRVQLPDEYTVKPLPIQKLGGRDPVTGRVVVGTVGGGSKQRFRWVDNVREPLEDGSPREERVLRILYDPLRTSMIALVGHGNHLRYILAHQGMEEGSLVTTYGDIPRIPIRPKIGDSHPLGALPAGTEVFSIEQYKGDAERRLCIAGGTYGTILRKVGKRVIIQMPSSKRQFSFRQDCTCVVGRALVRYPAKYPIGSAQRLRHLGYRPRSGLWQRKTGRFGRKLRRPPPLRDYDQPPLAPHETVTLHLADKYIYDRNSTDKFFVHGRWMSN